MTKEIKIKSERQHSVSSTLTDMVFDIATGFTDSKSSAPEKHTVTVDGKTYSGFNSRKEAEDFAKKY